MAYKCREEVVGKRFLSVSGLSKLKVGRIADWGWRAGVIRAATHRDNTNKDLQVLVEYDDLNWQRREWINVYKEGLFHMFLVEQGLFWVERVDPYTSAPNKVMWPALTFSTLVSSVDITSLPHPVEFLLDRELHFTDYSALKPFQEWDPKISGVRDYPEVRAAVRRWAEQQDGQRILLTTPSVLVGYRVEVYRAEGTTQWYTAVIIGYNEATRDLTVTDDTVLEEHNEDPSLVQMRLIGDGVVESIMRGENVGITPRRSRSAVLHTQIQQGPRISRALPSINSSITTRKSRTLKLPLNAETARSSSPDPDKGSVAKGTRRRKASENDSVPPKLKANFCNVKEDLENKQGRKKNLLNRGGNKKKVLEEANNTKLKDVQVRVEDCLQNVPQSSALSTVCRRIIEESATEETGESSPKDEQGEKSPTSDLEEKSSEESSDLEKSVASPEKVLEKEQEQAEEAEPQPEREREDVVSAVDETLPEVCSGSEDVRESSVVEGVQCASSSDSVIVVVEERTTGEEAKSEECSSRGDDEGPLSSSSPFRMELAESSSASLRFPDDRSDSGVSSLRSGSGDERSGSRSSALSSSDEPPPSSAANSQPQQQPQQPPNNNRSPIFVPATQTFSTPSAEPVRVWRDPNLLLESEPHVRHIHSVQHQTLLMSHPSAPAASGPPTSAAAHPNLYPHPSVGPQAPSLMSPHPPHPLQHHHLPPPTQLYAPHIPEMIWKQQYHRLPMLSQPSHSAAAEEILDQQRAAAYAQDRDRLRRQRQNLEVREIEKQKEREKERERLERQEREKMDRERERDKHEKERQEQAVQKHFEESLKKLTHQKQRDQSNWLINLPPPSRTSVNSNSVEEDRKRVEQEMQHREQEQQRHLSSRQDARERSYYSPSPAQRPPSLPGNNDYPPPAHSRIPTSKAAVEKTSSHHSLPKAEVNVYGFAAYQPSPYFPHDAKGKPTQDHHHKNMVVGKNEREMVSANPSSLMTELNKNSVIVKHDPKTPNWDRVKLHPDILRHVSSKGLYEFRNTSQSPLHMHAPSPHHMEPQNLGKPTHHRSSGQMASPHHQRHSPHPHSQSHPAAAGEMRYRTGSESQAIMYPAKCTMGTTSYSYIPTTTAPHPQYTIASASNMSNTKPKVSSPAPHHIYGKPSAVPVTRAHESPGTNPLPLTSKPPLSSSVSPSPYQQVSPYHPPHPQTANMHGLPPPAHSSKLTSTTGMDPRAMDHRVIDPRSDPRYAGSVPGALSVKPIVQHGTSPPTAASAPSPVARAYPQYIAGNHPVQNPQNVQTQPLDLGVSSNKYESASSPKRKGTPVSSAGPVCLDVKKRRVESPVPPQNLQVYTQPQLARVSEPSPLIVSAATTITTVVNTAAYRNPVNQSQVLSEVLPDVSVTTVTIPVERPSESTPPLATTASTVSISGPPAVSTPPLITNTVVTTAAPIITVPQSVTPQPTDSPSTPAKPVTPSIMDSEKSNSPGPQKTSTNYPVRHLKKAWLQRHTGEDLEDTTGVTGSGSCVTLPLNIAANNPPASKDPPVNSIVNIGSMAVNSINKTKHFSAKNNRKPKDAALNGHPDSAKGDDSSSSGEERGRKSPPKRKPPKVKRKKGGGPKKPEEKKRKVSGQSAAASESGSDSEKESGSEKDSDSGASTAAPNKKSVNNKDKEPRKRGRRPKSKNDKGEESRPKKSRDESVPQRDPFRKPPVGQLKKTGESFLQDGPCFEVAPKLAKCRECRWTPNQRSKNMPNIFCRFYAFRRLRYTKNGQLAIAGFSDPHKDAHEEDIKLWLPSAENPPSDLDLETSRFILKQVGDHFCDLLVQEKEAHNEHMSEDKVVAWKRVVQGVREMCDVCETTLFNFHWACGKCGFVVCLDCYKGRKNGTLKVWGEPGKDRDDCSWLLCTNRQAHEQEKLMLTQIIAGDSLQKLGRLVHEMRELWNIEQYCECPLSKEVSQKSNGAHKEIIKSILSTEVNGIKKEPKEEPDVKPVVNGNTTVKDEKSSPLSWLADVALSNEDKKTEDNSSDSDDASFSTLRELLIRPAHKPNGSRANSPVPNAAKANNKKSNSSRVDNLDEVISSVIEDTVPKNDVEAKVELKHFVRRDNWQQKSRGQLPNRIMTLTESKQLYPDIPHSWLCDGRLLRLMDPTHADNSKIFQDQWKRGQPVLVSDVSKYLSKDLWNPEAFTRDFGEEKNDLVNCINGSIVENQPMKKFWDGFEHFSKRLKDDRGNPMLLKLKDWPPGEDFAEMLPTRFADLMRVLPLSEYTHRNGKLNLASRLPDTFVRPDLGPKMYNAYGSALHPSKGTTNLHLDISDAVNVMVYVGIPKDSDSDEHIKEAFRAIDEAGCDILTRRRVRDKGELPGALWHIYNARDADKIRDLLNKVVVEKGGYLEPNHDPIHDQSCYLDGPLRERLYKEYGVEGYAIVQCLGDAVFIPAGAPHQVRNLHNCIKVAEDFVSPENVSHCFHLTQEFRDLSDTHSNHEDKLQIKNIIYHAVKDSLSSLSSIINKHAKGEENGDKAPADSAEPA